MAFLSTAMNKKRIIRVALRASLLLRLSVLVGSVFSVLILRRHLMLWAVFAPKLIFESVFFVVYSFFYTLLLYTSRDD